MAHNLKLLAYSKLGSRCACVLVFFFKRTRFYVVSKGHQKDSRFVRRVCLHPPKGTHKDSHPLLAVAAVTPRTPSPPPVPSGRRCSSGGLCPRLR